MKKKHISKARLLKLLTRLGACSEARTWLRKRRSPLRRRWALIKTSHTEWGNWLYLRIPVYGNWDRMAWSEIEHGLLCAEANLKRAETSWDL